MAAAGAFAGFYVALAKGLLQGGRIDLDHPGGPTC